MSTPPIEVEPFEARLYAEVEKQHKANEKAVGHWSRRQMGHPVGHTYYDDENNYLGYHNMRWMHWWSPLAWSVPCPVKTCLAEVDKRCNLQSGHTHAKREEAYHAKVGYGMADVDRPTWYKRWRLRREQHRVVVVLEMSAYNQTLANNTVHQERMEAVDLGVTPEMVRRAVDHGHKRAAKEISKNQARRWEYHEGRKKRVLE